MNWRSVFFIFVVLLGVQGRGDDLASPDCPTGTCDKPAVEHHSLLELIKSIATVGEVKKPGPPSTPRVEKRIPDDSIVTDGACPSEILEMDKTFNVELEKEVFTVAVPQPKRRDKGGWFVDTPPKIETKHRCHFAFRRDCGSGSQISTIEKLDWLKSNLRKVNPQVCQKVVDDFGEKCGPWAGLSDDQRKKKALLLAQMAVESYNPGPTAALLPGGVPIQKNKSLSSHLVQCLMHRENHKFEPNKLNYTECNTAISSANGLFQILESTAKDFIKRNILGNYCWQFHGYWEKVLPEKRGTEFANAALYPKPKRCGDKINSDLVKNMGDYPEFQTVIGVGMINYFLELSEQAQAKKTHFWQRKEDMVKYALDHYWFTTGNDKDSKSVLTCKACLDKGGENCL